MPPMCERCFIAQAQRHVMRQGRELEIKHAIEEAKLAVLN